MPPPSVFAVPQTTIGLAIETVRGTPVAPTFWAKVKGPKYKPDLTLLTDETLQGSMVQVYDLVPGLRYDSHGWDGYPRLDSFPVYVRAELGSPDTLGTAATATTLSAAALAGATTISTTAALAAGDWVVVGSGLTQETHLVLSVASLVATLVYPLNYPQASGATVTGLTSHKFSLLNNDGSGGNQPPSVTITDFDGEEWRQLSAAQLDKLTIKGTGNTLVDYTCDWFANGSIAPSAPSPAFTGSQALPSWTANIAINGVPVTHVMDWEIDLGRGVKPIPALTGTQAYYEFFAGALTATGKITVVETAGAPELTQYLEAKQMPIDFTLYDLKNGWALNLHSTLAEFNTGSLDRGKEWVEAQLDFQCLPTATDATAGGVSPIQITVANSQATTY